ncbi:MAG: hypothetical protein SFW36_03860 [Leptolyngbyaceae cyanobacterium bins.59]|nr:hypothetical protein [Leptolyngbyaceae cyanobacterium bins.59]
MQWVKTLAVRTGSLCSLLLLATYPLVNHRSLVEPGKLLAQTSLASLSGSVQIGLEPSGTSALTVSAASASPSPLFQQPPVFPSPTFNSEQLDRQLVLYYQYLELSGPPDVLIVGSSRALSGIDPLTLQQTLWQRGYSDLRVFNFSINGATAQVIDILLRQILTPDQLPRMIIWGDGVRAFNSGRPDHTYQKIVVSQGLRSLLAFRSRPSGQSPETCAIAPIASLLQNRRPFWLTLTAALRPPAVQKPCPVPDAIGGPIDPGETILDRERLGFQIITQQFNPTHYFRQFPRVSGRYDGDYHKFNLRGSQHAALVRVTQFARNQRIPLVFVNLPLTATYMDSTRIAYERQFWNYMQQFDRRDQLIFRNLNRPNLAKNQYFMDPSHINERGARAVALALGQDATLPWPHPWSSLAPLPTPPIAMIRIFWLALVPHLHS